MNCDTVLRTLDPFRTLEVEAREHDDLSHHLHHCPECAEELVRLERLAADLSRLDIRAPRKILAGVLAKSADCYASVDTELGLIWVGYTPRGLSLLRLSDCDRGTFEADYQARLGRRPRPTSLPKDYVDAIRRVAEGKGQAAVPLDLSSLSPFEREVLLLLRRIPRGEVRPYHWLAREAGRPKATRAVGQALAHNPLPLLLPCHRVVPAQGGVGRYIFGSHLKRRLLQLEGVAVKELER